MTDCLIVGFNDMSFESYEGMVRLMGGARSPSYRDLALAFITLNGKPHRALDVINTFNPHRQPLHNADFMWPVVTYLCSFLAKHKCTYDYINLYQQEKDLLREKLLHDNVIAVAVTTTLYVIPDPVIEIIEFVRTYNRTAKIIVGGPFIANQYTALRKEELEGLLSLVDADVYVIGREGEATLVKIITALKQEASLDHIPNIAYKGAGGYVITNSEPEANSLEDNPVDYRLFPREQLGQFVSIRTAKSCPFSCSFCGFPQRAGNYTYTRVECVEKELNAIRELTDVSTITVLDDTFNVPKGRFKDILKMMIKNNYQFRWNSFYRCDHGDWETIKLMGAAGCEGVFLGVESGSDSVLEKMNKSARRKDYLAAIPALRDEGITTYASLIVGFPGETQRTIEETVDLVEKARPDFFRTQLWYCEPGTPIWKQRDQFGVRGQGFGWSHNTMDSEAACEVIDNIFLDVNASIWLPQFGFEFWSMFYLQRKGMQMQQIRRFLKAFNAIIREYLRSGRRAEIPPALLAELKSASTDAWDPLGNHASASSLSACGRTVMSD